MREQRTRIWRLTLWFCLNLIIFVACYLNYRLQLKHRYLYKTLNVGLCFSRAAAMVINLNLLLVWLPMCKYTLTRLACLANGSLRRQKQKHQQQHHHHYLQTVQVVTNLTSFDQGQQAATTITRATGRGDSLKLWRAAKKIKSSVDGAIWQLRRWFSIAKMNSLNSFLIAVDHCKSLHTICATTITIASVIHTVAHLINVINFSKNFDPLLSNLNMAEYKGQNPLQLLVSVPGITGCLMIIILILMSLSSVDFIRNSSYDLFQIFHRLSVIFVLLLFLHPSSHVLKEQSNVARHHPELCYVKMTTTELNPSIVLQAQNKLIVAARSTLPSNITQSSVIITSAPSEQNFDQYQGQFNSSATTYHYNSNNNYVNNKTTTDLNNIRKNHSNKVTATTTAIIEQQNFTGKVDNTTSAAGLLRTNLVAVDQKNNNSNRFCLDPKPLFVAQSSICWYVLSIGLSCYLLDLILRKLRRSKSSIQLLDARLDCEGNLIELILSNNHKRFSHWLPGQFVYLNCPQIAAYEWHPFTISSMDNRSRRFTLHIKTGGDWTRKLRHKLECMQTGSMCNLQNQQQQHHYKRVNNIEQIENIIKSSFHLEAPILPGLDCYNKTGQLQVECTKIIGIKQLEDNSSVEQEEQREGCMEVDLDNHQRLYSICRNQQHSVVVADDNDSDRAKPICSESLNLFIDGPFHSPFERLLEQQVSVCIANGVGWTAFSSVFQCITNNFTRSDDDSTKDWWTKWRNYAISSNLQQVTDNSSGHHTKAKQRQFPDTKLHLMVIVTSIEQLKPFYNLALNYYNRIHDECQIKVGDQLNPVREITAFITRSTKEDETIKEFCRQENLSTYNESHAIRVNDMFTIHLGKPEFDVFLGAFSAIYPNSQKISVYCCGSYQVKKTVQEICQNLNKIAKHNNSNSSGGKLDNKWPFYSYHEENF